MSGKMTKPGLEYDFDISIAIDEDIQSLIRFLDGKEWEYKIGKSGIRIFPTFRIREDVNVDDLVSDILLRKKDDILFMSAFGTARQFLIGMFFDVRQVAAVGIQLSSSTMMKIAEMGYELEIFVYPCNDDDGEEVEQPDT
jgi:hypothetical protein